METIKHLDSVKQASPEELPSLFKHVAAKAIDGFDNVEEMGSMNHQCQPTWPTSANPSPNFTVAKNQDDASQTNDIHHACSISISMPCSPLGVKRVLFSDEGGIPGPLLNTMVANRENPKQAKFHSQPLPCVDLVAKGNFLEPPKLQKRNPRVDRLKDKRFDSFKTWSGKLERQVSHLRGKQQETEPEVDVSQNTGIEHLPVDRYFDALEGPELETLRVPPLTNPFSAGFKHPIGFSYF